MAINAFFSREYGNLNNFYKRKDVKLYLSLVLTLAAISFFAFFAIRPTLVTIAELFREIEEKKEIAEKLQDKIDNLVKAQQEYEKVKPQLYLIDEALPQYPHPSLLTGQINYLIYENGAKSTRFNTVNLILKGRTPPEVEKTKGRKQGEVATFELSLALAGGYEELRNTLKAFWELRRIINIEEIKISSANVPKGKEKLNMGLEAVSFYLPD